MSFRIHAIRTVLVGFLVAALTVVAATLSPSALAADGLTWRETNTRILDHQVVTPGQPVKVALPVPSRAVQAKLVVAAQGSARPSRVSVCPGGTMTAECKANPVLTTPVQNVAYAHITLDITNADRKVTVDVTDASTTVTLKLASWASGSTSPAPEVTPPGPGNTGVPAGTKLTVREGDLMVDTPNAVIDSMEIRGIVRVRTTGVVIKNSLITGRRLDSSLSLIYVNPGASVTVEDSELYAKDETPHVRGIIGSNFTLRRVNMHHVIDHMAITGDNVLVESSWLHDNLYYEQDPYYNGTPTHDDNAQIAVGSNITFRGNTLEGTHNAAIQVTQDRGAVSNLTLEGNWISNGACSVNLAQNKWGPVKNVVLTNNVFTRTQKYDGCAIIADYPTVPEVRLSGNTWPDGTPVTSIQGREVGQKGGS
ncbi:right-handed parallel beta-helix repeat-containing protein [Cellulomonas wangsupingiae]|uniref:Right-handed parallel beta-helix repeat-containing protein n=1 Tax=Cellulomonas wangsupingiae TaxID=2968085 RepID=A0ABY5KA64_9CELL|nr:right-handed parallel beta-helix repeat-containing protein [Cellulomonas wangsupingiae]MCC2334335.1 right-handed parallel beta-helix repeat-containing protein [Cellulomonas wangsupingiae]MCM0640792.1 right-handed parallel beta-helix repeat-containing protein [Cellulomonas wangsupingiae]UUI66007.1 right-handed parallel beta-helix repeat-containing protein [Cellulomonas wangsupingiae]